MSGPLISDLPLWERHEKRVLATLRSTLHRLRATRPEGGDELKLNRELYFCILEANKENYEHGHSWFDYPPLLDARNPPTPDTEDSASERKMPDLSWGYMDHQERDPRRSVRNFTIECKRLGSPSKSGWNFNSHYVEDGVRRFTDPEWRYGASVATGSMVGYVESLTPGRILSEVNEALGCLGVPALVLPPRLDDPLTEIDHSFPRPFAISPFRLVHLWIDLRPTADQAPPSTWGTSPLLRLERTFQASMSATPAAKSSSVPVRDSV